ncbi:MAG: membrane protein insertion efficiency factor YidD [Candidatus Pacebacteria bacterium]|nr:membrane protein insertion efficiency factor YidD [Candidatus Paceibacterota bacterium]
MKNQKEKTSHIISNGIIYLISWYQVAIKPHSIHSCVFHPHCSDYTKQVIEKYGARRGLWMGFKRFLRCHPWQKNRIDIP